MNLEKEQIEVLRRTIARDCDDSDFQLFLQVCIRTNLDPFAKQICPVYRWNEKIGCTVMSIQIQIDGFRVLAQRTGEYAGSDKPLYDEGLSLYQHLQVKRPPQTCSVTVYRLVNNHRCPFTSEISWDEFYPGKKVGFMWDSKPYQMLAKTAESHALRKAFQLELTHLVTEDEINTIDAVAVSSGVLRSDAWFDAQRQLKEADSIPVINQLERQIKERIPVRVYHVEKETQIARERVLMKKPIPSKKAATQDYLGEADFPSKQTINYLKGKTQQSIDLLREIAADQKLPSSSSEMNEDQIIIMVRAMIIAWLVSAHWIDFSQASTMVQKSIERSKKDADLWDDIQLSIEAFKEESRSI
jgi:phage recombination protein Bet